MCFIQLRKEKNTQNAETSKMYKNLIEVIHIQTQYSRDVNLKMRTVLNLSALLLDSAECEETLSNTEENKKKAEKKYKELENKIKNAEAEALKERKNAEQKLDNAKKKADTSSKKIKDMQQVKLHFCWQFS